MSYSPNRLIPHQFLRGKDDEVVSGNERKLLRMMWETPGLSRSEVTARVDLAQQSVHRLLDTLAERGLVHLGAPKSGLGSGQPSPMLSLRGDHAWTLGISLNSDVIDLCLLDFAGQVLAQDTFSIGSYSMNECLSQIEKRLRKLAKALGLREERFFGIGFAIAGFHVDGTRYNATLPLQEWSLIELSPLLSDRFGKPVWTINGGKAGAVAEAMFGVGRQVKHFAYLSFNYGFGGGLISDGALLHGGHGNAGEFSQMYDEEEVRRRPALQLLMEALHRNGVELPTIAALRQRFDPHWPGLVEWVDDVAPAYQRLINAIWAVYDPQAVVFGGEIPSPLAQMLIQRTRLYGKARYGVSRPHPKLLLSDIGADAAAMGAAVRPLSLSFF